jgi:cytochrome c peroxidase
MRRLVAGLAIVLVSVTAFVDQLGAQDFGPLRDQDYRDGGQPDGQLVELGRLLFFDEVMSGNRNISCATCHHPDFFSGDGLSLGLGEGGRGIGLARTTGRGGSRVRERVPRNAPALFNIGARQQSVMFHDGRVEAARGQASGFRTPAGDQTPQGLSDVVAAQALFPLVSGTEMAGQRGENEIGRAVARGEISGAGGAWDLVVDRLRAIPEYVARFRRVFDDVGGSEDMSIAHAANAIAAFESSAFRSDQSPFDRFLRAEPGALTPQQDRGRRLFYGRADCSRCHSGPLQTDNRFHSIAMPQIGPGKGDGFDGHEDFGRERVTGDPRDRYRFRTPSLRNVELTGPWGHSGAYATLEAMVRHYDNPQREIREYDQGQAILPSRRNLNLLDFLVMDDPARVARIADSNQARPTRLNGQDVDDLVAFLRALTDPRAYTLGAEAPVSVPSGLLTR